MVLVFALVDFAVVLPSLCTVHSGLHPVVVVPEVVCVLPLAAVAFDRSMVGIVGMHHHRLGVLYVV